MKHREQIDVVKGGKEITVHNVISVRPAYHISGGNPTKEMFPSATVIEGREGQDIDYVTEWCAEELWMELDIDDLTEYGIAVIDIEDDDITVI